jgi:hypothetical protein
MYTSTVLALRALGLVYFVAALFSFAQTGGGHRFTWWNVFIFSLFCLSGGRRGIRGIALLTSTIVFVGVVVMSLRECSLFQESFDDMGFWVYTLGTFTIHYLPFAVIVCTIIFGPSSRDIDVRKLGPGAIIVCSPIISRVPNGRLIMHAGRVSVRAVHKGKRRIRFVHHLRRPAFFVNVAR